MSSVSIPAHQPVPTIPLPTHLIRTESPIGRLEITSDGASITSLTIERNGRLPHDSQKSIWEALAAVGWGEYISYGQLGFDIGKPSSGRAVGGAIRANPIPILIGCHRVLSSDGRITGYSGGDGVTRKLWLLEHEAIGHKS